MTALLRALLLGLVRLLVGAQARWQGAAPARRQRIYFANHSSHLDTLVIIAALPPELRGETHPVAALDYWGMTAFRRYIALECLNAVLIDRSGAADDPLQPLARLLEAGQSLIIFPEGTRGSGTIGPFRSGLYYLTLRFPAAELVPVYLENLNRILPKKTMLLVPLICTARFGAPLAVRPGEGKAEFLARAREAVLALSDARTRWSGAPPRTA
jgi:1-acyl-sn-glycerol-3-phosphate acyltransferase